MGWGGGGSGEGEGEGADVSMRVAHTGGGVGGGDPVGDGADVNCDGVVDQYDLGIATCQLGPDRGDPGLCDQAPGACCWGCVTYPGGPEFVCADLSRTCLLVTSDAAVAPSRLLHSTLRAPYTARHTTLTRR